MAFIEIRKKVSDKTMAATGLSMTGIHASHEEITESSQLSAVKRKLNHHLCYIRGYYKLHQTFSPQIIKLHYEFQLQPQTPITESASLIHTTNKTL